MRRYWMLLGLFALGAALQPACAKIGANERPLVFPPAARLGDTVGMSIDTNAFALGNQIEKYDLSDDNVTIRVQDPDAGGAQVQILGPRAVIKAGVPDAVQFDAGSDYIVGGTEITILLLDLPDPMAQTFVYPKTLELQLLVDGAPVSGFVGTLTILGDAGSPVVFSGYTSPLDMQPKPMVRLRGKYDSSGVAGFPGSSTPVAGIEFTLAYPAAQLSGPQVYPASSASGGTVILGPEVDDGLGNRSVRVVLVDPEGFALANDTLGHVGEGPILDIVFQKLASFDETTVQIQDLRVTDVDGAVVASKSGDAGIFFTILPVKNL